MLIPAGLTCTSASSVANRFVRFWTCRLSARTAVLSSACTSASSVANRSVRFWTCRLSARTAVLSSAIVKYPC